VILPDLNAGCSMADMARPDDVYKAWDALHAAGIDFREFLEMQLDLARKRATGVTPASGAAAGSAR